MGAGYILDTHMKHVHADADARHNGAHFLQIADFGLSRDLMDEMYYVSQGGKIPVKWTAPEVGYLELSLTASHRLCC